MITTGTRTPNTCLFHFHLYSYSENFVHAIFVSALPCQDIVPAATNRVAMFSAKYTIKKPLRNALVHPSL